MSTDWKAEARKWEQRAKDNRARADRMETEVARLDALARRRLDELERLHQQNNALYAAVLKTLKD